MTRKDGEKKEKRQRPGGGAQVDIVQMGKVHSLSKERSEEKKEQQTHYGHNHTTNNSNSIRLPSYKQRREHTQGGACLVLSQSDLLDIHSTLLMLEMLDNEHQLAALSDRSREKV